MTPENFLTERNKRHQFETRNSVGLQVNSAVNCVVLFECLRATRQNVEGIFIDSALNWDQLWTKLACQKSLRSELKLLT